MADLAYTQSAAPADTPPQTQLRLGTFADAIREHPALDVPTLQWLIHKAADTGLDEHLYPRLDRKSGPPLLDLNGFAAWMRARRDARRDAA